MGARHHAHGAQGELRLTPGEFEVGEPAGDDEVFLLETQLPPVRTVVELANRVVTRGDGAPLDWSELPASQLGALALAMRRKWVGEQVVSEGTCPEPSCGDRFDVHFAVAAYLSHHRARRPRNVAASGDQGWFVLKGTGVQFRVPTVSDLMSAADEEEPSLALSTRCIHSRTISSRESTRINRALSALSPLLDGFVEGVCPSCGASIRMTFDPLTYTLAELRDVFGSVYGEIHAVASAYGWTEQTILAMPRSRRKHYSALIMAAKRSNA
jgi:hypothetical protein